MDGDICTLGMFEPPLVWLGVTAEGKLESVPLQDESNILEISLQTTSVNFSVKIKSGTPLYLV